MWFAYARTWHGNGDTSPAGLTESAACKLRSKKSTDPELRPVQLAARSHIRYTHSVSLADLALIPSPNWLNDAVVSLYYEWLRQDAYQQLTKSHSLLLIPPDTAFMLAAIEPAEAQQVLGSLEAHKYRMVRYEILYEFCSAFEA